MCSSSISQIISYWTQSLQLVLGTKQNLYFSICTYIYLIICNIFHVKVILNYMTMKQAQTFVKCQLWEWSHPLKSHESWLNSTCDIYQSNTRVFFAFPFLCFCVLSVVNRSIFSINKCVETQSFTEMFEQKE